MIYREMGDANVPALGFGTYGLHGEECVEAVSHALEIGYRHIDGAPTYDNEVDVGRAIRASRIARSELFLTTKVLWTSRRFDRVLRSAETSLNNLGTDYVDLLLMHCPQSDEPIEEPLEALTHLQAVGQARHIGVSNFTPSQLATACDLAPIVSDQTEYHPFLNQEPLKVVIREKGLLLIAYSPLAQGIVAQDPTLMRIGEKYDKTPFQVTLRWHLKQAYVAAIPKASSARHRESNFQVFDFDLNDSEMAEIFTLNRSQRLVDPEYSPAWRAWA
jgi:2,5-diketo-D-gluconate reductase B